MKRDIRELTKNKSYQVDDDAGVSREWIHTSALLRIADAVELMARRYQELVNDAEYYRTAFKNEQEANQRLNNTIRSLRGHITRAKNKKSPEDQL